jgi:hypothetical protein
MSQELVKICEWSADTLFYGTGNIVVAAADDSIAITDIGTYSPAGTRLYCASSEDAGNDGTHVVASVATADKILTSSVLTGNADDDAMVIRGESPGDFVYVGWYSRIVGVVSSDQDVSVYVVWSDDAAGTVTVSVTTAVTGGTPASIASEILAPYVRIRARNNDTSTATLSGTVWAKAVT